MNRILERDNIIVKDFAHILERVIRAIKEYGMIRSHDRVLVAVSGGKDSLTAMHFLDYLCKHKIFDFKMLCCNVDLGSTCADKMHLVEHFKAFGIDYCCFEKNILVDGLTRDDINCFWCSWNRRKALFESAKVYSCNKVSLGHHLDDVVHTALMNLFFRGEISTSPASVDLFGGELTIIRPLCYIKEEETEEFAKVLKVPLCRCACPQEQTSKRTFVKDLLGEFFSEPSLIRENVFAALKKLKESQELNSTC